MKSKYSEGLCKNVFHVRSAKDSMRENKLKVEDIYKSNGFKFSYIWNWGKIPELISDYEISGVACGKDGKVYAASRFTDHPIVIFDKNGNFLNYLGSGLEVGRIHGISVDDDNCVWYADEVNHVCCKLSPTGELLMMLGTFEKPSDSGADLDSDFGASRYLSIKRLAGPFNWPTKIVTGPDGYLYASDGYCNCAVHKFSSDGELIKSWGGPGEEPGHFQVVHALAVDSKSRVWVADRENKRVQIFTSDGELLKILDKLMYPSDIAVGGGYAYVSEIDSRISIYDMDFNLVSQIGAYDGTFHAHSIAVDEAGNLILGQMHMNHHLSNMQRI